MVNTIDVIFAIFPLTKYARDEARKGRGGCPSDKAGQKSGSAELSVRCHIQYMTKTVIIIIDYRYGLLGKYVQTVIQTA